jgi:hypothetical protein
MPDNSNGRRHVVGAWCATLKMDSCFTSACLFVAHFRRKGGHAISQGAWVGQRTALAGSVSGLRSVLREKRSTCSQIERERPNEMDFFQAYAMSLWIAIALVCSALGAFFTWRARRRQRAVLPPRPVRHVPAPMRASAHHDVRVCPACGKQGTDPGASFCWFCGHALSKNGNKPAPRRGWPSGTYRVEDINRQMPTTRGAPR